MTIEDTFKNLQSDIACSIVNQIRGAKLVQIPYSGLFKLPESFISDAWHLVDHEALKREISTRLEQELADRIVNHMAAEIATDIKSVLSIKERREAIRAVCRDNIEALTGGCGK